MTYTDTHPPTLETNMLSKQFPGALTLLEESCNANTAAVEGDFEEECEAFEAALAIDRLEEAEAAKKSAATATATATTTTTVAKSKWSASTMP